MKRFGSYWVDFREIMCWGENAKFTLEQAPKVQRGSRGIGVLFL